MSTNNSGQVVFIGNHTGDTTVFPLDDPRRNQRGVFLLESGQPVTTLAFADVSDINNTVNLDKDFPLELNTAGTTLIIERIRANQTDNFDLYTTDGSVRTTRVATENSTFTGFGSAALNDTDTVAFLGCTNEDCKFTKTAYQSPHAGGIFTGPNTQTDKIITIGDSLFGSTVTGLRFNQQGLNNAGAIAFVASLQDGRQLVVKRARSQSAEQ